MFVATEVQSPLKPLVLIHQQLAYCCVFKLNFKARTGSAREA